MIEGGRTLVVQSLAPLNDNRCVVFVVFRLPSLWPTVTEHSGTPLRSGAKVGATVRDISNQYGQTTTVP